MSKGWLDELPWAVDDLKREHRVSSRTRVKNNLWESAPDLDFRPPKRGESFISFEEPDFSKSLSNLNYDFNLEPDEPNDNFDDFATKHKYNQASNQFSNIPINKKEEIRDLFSQWKHKTHGDCTTLYPHVSKKNSPLSPQKSTTPKLLKKGKSKSTIKPESPVTNDSHSPSPTKRKKKIAVKLKATDLNLPKSEQEEIEKMFWEWKQKANNPTGDPERQHLQNSEGRWTDDQRSASASRPKATPRQPSITLEERRDTKANVKIQPIRASSRERPHPMRTRSRSASSNLPPSPSHDRSKIKRSRSRTRHLDRRRERSKSRNDESRNKESTKSGDEGKLRDPRESRRRSHSRTRSDEERKEELTQQPRRSKSKSRRPARRSSSNESINSQRRNPSRNRSSSPSYHKAELSGQRSFPL